MIAAGADILYIFSTL